MSKRNFKVHIAVWVLLLALLGGYYLFFAPRSSEYSPEETAILRAFPLSRQKAYSAASSARRWKAGCWIASPAETW